MYICTRRASLCSRATYVPMHELCIIGPLIRERARLRTAKRGNGIFKKPLAEGLCSAGCACNCLASRPFAPPSFVCCLFTAAVQPGVVVRAYSANARKSFRRCEAAPRDRSGGFRPPQALSSFFSSYIFPTSALYNCI